VIQYKTYLLSSSCLCALVRRWRNCADIQACKLLLLLLLLFFICFSLVGQPGSTPLVGGGKEIFFFWGGKSSDPIGLSWMEPPFLGWILSFVSLLYPVKSLSGYRMVVFVLNPLTPNDHYSRHTAPLTSKRCILFIYSRNLGTEYFKHDTYSSFYSFSNYSLFHNSNVFGSCIIHILCAGCAKIKKKRIPAPKG